ncbi:hypothetical protein QO002_002908 [Pararhizobium capsulatum DSM 1112]|uniref:Excisionase n=1 Tax=Pararhizobium capsulatum DSM 1112 TaxID=1121113 RepID=A0ABU0BRB1_9HYPH|nr:hypothetical protein [Pararhizobium capsulatum]MDQ0320770.1 hypothetical protein [Pararhizobium capsulatum DSM 1112]
MAEEEIQQFPEKYWLKLKEFGLRNGGISEIHVRKLIKEGDGPRTTYIGNRVFIALDDEAEWRERKRNPRGKAAEKALAVATMLSERARHAKQGEMQK